MESIGTIHQNRRNVLTGQPAVSFFLVGNSFLSFPSSLADSLSCCLAWMSKLIVDWNWLCFTSGSGWHCLVLFLLCVERVVVVVLQRTLLSDILLFSSFGSFPFPFIHSVLLLFHTHIVHKNPIFVGRQPLTRASHIPSSIQLFIINHHLDFTVTVKWHQTTITISFSTLPTLSRLRKDEGDTYYQCKHLHGGSRRPTTAVVHSHDFPQRP